MTKWLSILALAIAAIAAPAAAQNVAPLPFLKVQYFDNNGHVCAGCLLNTYQAGTTTPLATYTDAGGLTPNANPVVADSSGRMNVFVGGTAYKFVLTLANGSTLWTEDNITSSTLAIFASDNVWTGTNEFVAAVTFDSSATFDAGFTSSGPNILNGGGQLNGSYTGSPTFAGTPNFSNGFTSTTGTFSDQITSTVTTGTAPFVVASSTEVLNLNAAELEGATWESPLAIGSTTPAAVKATAVEATTGGFTDDTLSADSGDCAQIGTAGKIGAAGLPCNSPAAPVFLNCPLASPVSVSAGSPTAIKTCAVTMPSSGCPCRVLVSYRLYVASSNVVMDSWINDGASNLFAGDENQSSGSFHTSMGASAVSPVTYANSAAVTFTAFMNVSSGVTVNATSAESGPNSTVQATIITSQ